MSVALNRQRSAGAERIAARRWFRTAVGFAALIVLATLPALRQCAVATGEPEHTAAVAPHADGDSAAPAAALERATGPDGVGHEDAHGATAGDEHGGGTHGAAHGEEAHSEHPPELPNVITILNARYPDSAFVHFLHTWENQVFMFLYIIVLIVVAALGARSLERIPGPFQNGVEFVVESLDDFVTSILGPHGRRLVPFLGTLFVFILTMNYAGLVPFLKSPTANLNTTLAMALCVFLYVQWTGIRSFGIVGYLDHLAGSPRDVVGFVLMPIMLPLHIVGELVKPMSLSLRLFGNVTGEDVLLAVFVGLGVSLLGVFAHGLPFGIPLQAIVYPLLLIFGFIQALVFTLLSTIYFFMMLPHEEHH